LIIGVIRNVFESQKTPKAAIIPLKTEFDFRIRKRKELLEIRKMKINDLYSTEKENNDFELASNNLKNPVYTSNSFFTSENEKRNKSSMWRPNNELERNRKEIKKNELIVIDSNK